MMDLMKQLQKPEKFQQSDKMFWQEPHIAKYLLEAHLDPDFEGASRNHVFIDQSVSFITEVAAKKGNLNFIDFGCGPGLYCERLASRGYDVTGVDFSISSIQYARNSAEDKNLLITYRHEDYLHVSDENQYDFATLIYCDYGALAPPDRQRLLRNISKSLRKGGRLLLDVFTEQKYNDFSEGNHWSLKENGGFWSPEEHIVLTQNVKYDHACSLEQTTVVTNQKMETYNIWHQYFTKEMILAELEGAGFTVISVYGDVTGKEYTVGNDTVAVLLEK
ncbi:class I SAM-dependent methyltransferase [Bacillus sp. KH172YL63]|uniref:class I SAM-dependent methyltransferase n=1 Tax=Bacillus sp. KH172YL63 TaxID=2709784 RepID=UPI0013E414E5|nr:class I SAM-dependent methyltransferase [Bacillus sp. KH172YL63]BCB02561.1 SAM-dependent methyltransferase [Bacillus sp. KH172YL63]